MEIPDFRDTFNNLDIPSDKWDPYLDIYRHHVGPYISSGSKVKIVEVGVQGGGSLKMWSEVFSGRAKVIGIDIDPKCLDIKYPKEDNIEVVIGNQGDPEFWDKFLDEHSDIDIFVDDGGHFCNDQILTFEKVFPKLSDNSLYICEDTHTSYMGYNGGGFRLPGSFIEYSKGLVDAMHIRWMEEFDTKVDSKSKLVFNLEYISFYDSVVVFKKSLKRDMKRVFPKRHQRTD